MEPFNIHRIHVLRICALGFGLIASIMSTSILSVLTPEVIEHFNISMNTWQVRNVIFFAVFSSFLILFGKAVDQYDPKRLLLSSMSVFLFASIGSFGAVAGKQWPLFLVFQALQAVADAAMVPAIMKLIRRTFPEDKMGWAFGCFGAVLSAGGILGPGVGALFQGKSEWSQVFLVLAGLSAIGQLAVYRLFNSSLGGISLNQKRLSRDLISGVLLAIAIGAFQFLGRSEFWVWGALLLFLVAFIVNEGTRNGQESYVPWRFFKRSAFAMSSFRAFIAGIVSNVGILILPAALRVVYHIDAKVVAFALACEGVAVILAGGMSGRFADKNTLKAILFGNLIMFFALLLFADLVLVPSGPLTIAYFVVLGLASTLTSAAQSKLVILSLSESEAGHGMGLFHSLNFISGAFSAGLLATLFVDDHFNMTTGSWTLALTVCAGLISLNIASLAIDARCRREDVPVS